MRTELSAFAEQVASFTWQYRCLDLLWKVAEVLCHIAIPTAPVALLEIVKAVRQCPFKHSCTAPWILHKLITQVCALCNAFKLGSGVKACPVRSSAF